MHKAKSAVIAGVFASGLGLSGAANAAVEDSIDLEVVEVELFISVLNKETSENIIIATNVLGSDFAQGAEINISQGATDALVDFLSESSIDQYVYNVTGMQQDVLADPFEFSIYSSVAPGDEVEPLELFFTAQSNIFTFTTQHNQAVDSGNLGNAGEDWSILDNHELGGFWNENIGGALYFSNEVPIESEGFLPGFGAEIFYLPSGFGGEDTTPELVGAVMLSADGTFTFTPATAIPLPPAVWMLGSALVGLAGVARRRAA